MILEMARSMAGHQALLAHSKNNRRQPESIRSAGRSFSHRAKWEASLCQNCSAPWSKYSGYPFPAYHHPPSGIRPLQPHVRPGILPLLVIKAIVQGSGTSLAGLESDFWRSLSVGFGGSAEESGKHTRFPRNAVESGKQFSECLRFGEFPKFL
jgi:hypothetical protein